MSKSGLKRTALIAALMSAGIAFGAQAQNTQPAAPKSSANAQSQSPSTASTTAPPASTTDRSTGKVASTLESKDRKFIEKAARDGMAEVELAKLAQDKASNDQVKQFAKRMADDHTKANDDLKKIAEAKGVTLPADVDRGERREMDKLAKKSGADFDRDYMKHMVSDHKDAVKEFRNEAKSGKDADVKNFAASTLPTLEQHLDLAKSTEQAAKSAGRGTPGRETSATQGTTSPSSSSGGAPAPARTTAKSGASS